MATSSHRVAASNGLPSALSSGIAVLLSSRASAALCIFGGRHSQLTTPHAAVPAARVSGRRGPGRLQFRIRNPGLADRGARPTDSTAGICEPLTRCSKSSGAGGSLLKRPRSASSRECAWIRSLARRSHPWPNSRFATGCGPEQPCRIRPSTSSAAAARSLGAPCSASYSPHASLEGCRSYSICLISQEPCRLLAERQSSVRRAELRVKAPRHRLIREPD
ncbi:hypothetical protein BU26DRAFT_5867 [Trematosphaeria pertusa]|uniref:Uncharacterized protein n=1 Tax=Trematosphaeria pertusa TaxID=390896 RepID=A0A6A6IZ32_9PLEO|nr:uncharacterized protein BU26DRAFT_5867 [Trematosphaeria pertusa]KAF2255684.1 hypothetical protein BU26DRAFT_5867 [Trematosphaeria pertusa]